MTLLRETRHALRLFGARPGFSLTAGAIIALAIAGNTLVFGLVQGILLAPLPLPEPDRLVRIEEVHPSGTSNLTGATFVDVRSTTTAFAALAAFRMAPSAVSAADRALQATQTTVTADYFAVLGVRPLHGRLAEPADFVAGAEPVVFISQDLWRRLFDGDPAAVGRTMLVGGATRRLAGIAAVPASAPGAADVWAPLPSNAPLLMNRRARLYTTIGRLRPGVAITAASAELAAVAAAIIRRSAEVEGDLAFGTTPLRDRIVQPVRSSLLVLWGAVGVLLMIAFANVANLLLMEGSLRGRELSLRSALGAPRSALIRQLAIEAAVLGVAGGVAGAVLGAWGLQVLRSVLPASMPRVSEVRTDVTLIAFGVALSVAAAIAFGLVAAIRSSRRDAAAALRGREDSPAGSRLRDALVAAEVALTLVLLFGAALLGRSLLAVSQVPIGFDARDVLAVDLSLPAAKYDGTAAQAQFYGEVLQRLAATPGLDGAGVTGALPLAPTAATTMVPQDGRTDQDAVADVITVTPGVFRALRLRLDRGRALDDTDRAGARPVAVINQTAARTLWPSGVDPIGRTIEMRDWGAPYLATVVGIAADVRQAGPDQAARAAVYYPLWQFPHTTLTQTIVVRSSAPPERTLAGVRAAIRDLDPSQPVGSALPMEARLAAALAPRRFNLWLLAAFASAALLLAAVGVYGIVAFALAARTREIAIRIALGAPPGNILRFAARRGLGPIAAGALTGVVASWIVAAGMRSLVFGVPPRDIVSLAAAAGLVGAAALAAIVGPARRALRVDPATSLR